jgi:hypothetical protein
MANLDKNIVITPNVGSTTTDPQIVFSGANASLGPQNITLRAYPTSNGTLSFEGSAGQLFSITNSLTGTIFSVNDVSGIPSIEVLDNGIVKLAEFNGFVAYGVSPAVTAAGTTQAAATSLTRTINNVTTVPANSGVRLPAAVAGMRIIVRNGTASTILRVYPAGGGQINALGANVAFQLDGSANIEFVAFSTTQWYTVNATYA